MVDVAELSLTYTRRKRFEAKLLAGELASMLGPQQTGVSKPTAQSTNHVHPDVLFNQMGVVIQ